MRISVFFFILTTTLLLSGCGSGTARYEGIRFPATTSSQVRFQEHSVPADCSAFAHLLMNSKMSATGKEIAEAMEAEGMDKGADLILIGMARELAEEKLEENRFDYYGPEYAYNFSKTWLGWKFGFGDWNHAGDLVGLGVDSWGKSDISFASPLLIQAVFLRCGE
ncbi:MAG: hypothetical protein ABFR63_05200 [Thermodesulfobacteriota bacterium]